MKKILAILAAGLVLAPLVFGQSSISTSDTGSKPQADTGIQEKGFAFFIGFESDPQQSVPNGFMSVDSDLASFTDSGGSRLEVDERGEESNFTNAMILQDDDPSFIIIDFTTPMRAVSMDFGNDDACCSAAGDEAVLSLFLDGTPVDEVRVVMNRNDIMDQTIEYDGQCFDQANFLYDVTGDGLIEIIDNIEFELCGAATIPAVSLPGLAILIALLAGLGLAFSRRPKAN